MVMSQNFIILSGVALAISGLPSVGSKPWRGR